MNPEPCRLADKPEDYAHFNLERRHIQRWEDGIRIDTGAPNARESGNGGRPSRACTRASASGLLT